MRENRIDPNLLLIGGLLVAGYFVFSGVLEKFGLKESKEDAEANRKLKEQEAKYNIWGGIANLSKAAGRNAKMQVLTKAGAEYYAKLINSAFGLINDDEQKIYGVFRSIRFKSQVASIVTAYQTLYKKDLLTTLKQRLSQNEMNEIVNIIETKPLGITK